MRAGSWRRLYLQRSKRGTEAVLPPPVARTSLVAAGCLRPVLSYGDSLDE